MYNTILQEFKLLSTDKQVMIWESVMQNPVFLDFLVTARRNVQNQYFNLAEPETFDHANLAQNAAERRQFKTTAELIDNLIGIDKFMRDKVEATK